MSKKKHKVSAKYHTDPSSEYEPGSRGKVLKNLLGISSVRKMEDAELKAYMFAERAFLAQYSLDHKFTVADINTIHHIFLGHIYSWAGTYRTVNLTKGGFPFATAMAIPRAMQEFERTILQPNTPCRGRTLQQVAALIAGVHAELLLIHPYREGNGRTARLLATLMAYQAGMPGIDFWFIGSRGKEFQGYVRAIQHAIHTNYKPMQSIVERGLRRALRLRARR